uniref:Uncharacterized protein n=1 Tax=Zosterops lateralis melanops TaxID=1220523 RepID=A0A8D2PUN4_ZOSLA
MRWKSDLCPVGRAHGPTQHCCIPVFICPKQTVLTNVRHETQQQQPGRKVNNLPEGFFLSGVQQEENIHYADIQVFSKARERSAAEVKSLQLQNATEYATLNFPRARLKYDSKNGTLV